MTPEEAQKIAAYDQAIAGARAIAQLLGAMYQELRQQGVPPTSAATIIGQYAFGLAFRPDEKMDSEDDT